MAEFLNTKKLGEYLIKTIESAEKELVLISPYIQASDTIIDLLQKAEKRGVEITVVYKEGDVKDSEKNKFLVIDNLNLLKHHNLHSKCFYNEKYLIIGSMNLYDYSQRNNREMGVLFRRTDEEEFEGWNAYKTAKDDESIFQDAIAEIQSIIKGSDFEKESRETKTIGFEMEIIKTEYDLTIERCNTYNKYSKNKKFSPLQSGEEWHCICENYIDGVDIIIENNRARIDLNFDKNRILQIFDYLGTKKFNNDYRAIECFRMFWTNHSSPIYLYMLKEHPIWEMDKTDEYYSIFFEGFNEVFKIIKPKIIETKR
jgi:hypothetical protein